jgi:hypothetical protein
VHSFDHLARTYPVGKIRVELLIKISRPSSNAVHILRIEKLYVNMCWRLTPTTLKTDGCM